MLPPQRQLTVLKVLPTLSLVSVLGLVLGSHTTVKAQMADPAIAPANSAPTQETTLTPAAPTLAPDLSAPTAQDLAPAPSSAASAPVESPATTAAPTNSPSTPVAPVAQASDAAELTATVQVLTPEPSAILDTNANSVILQFPANDPKTGTSLETELRVNGVLVDPAAISRSEVDASKGLVTQTWHSIIFNEGKNTITARVKGQNGWGPVTTVPVQVRGTPKEIKVSTLESRIPADGRSTATVQVQLLDENGTRSNRDLLVTLSSNGGEFTGVDADKDQDGFQIKTQQGVGTATLRAGLDAKTVQIRATVPTLELEGFNQLRFETNLRPSLVSGVIDVRLGARGTDYYRSFREFLPPDQDNRTQLDVRSAVFATGRVGEWLLTGAYNSDRPLNQVCNGNALFRNTQACDRQNYSVYGDSSTVTPTAPSLDSVFLKLERSAGEAGTDYAMWGDYNTEEFATAAQQFTAITRQLHGFKTNFNFGNLQLSGFYGNNVQGFQRDTITPDGTSGYYFLSRRLLISGSENVVIETEELNRPGTVISRTPLTRIADYDIDYDRGSLLFRTPQLATDFNDNGEVLVRRIVITYQYDDQSAGNSIYGGRLRYHLSRELGQERSLGLTYQKETQGIRGFELYGADLLYSLNAQTRLIAEYARSNNTSEGPTVSGSAYNLELNTQLSPQIQGRAYYRSTESGFTNYATTSFVPGQTRYGGQVSAQLSSDTQLRLQYDHEDNVGVAPRPLSSLEDLLTPRTDAVPGSQVDNSLTTWTAGLQQKLGNATLGLDFVARERQDRLPPNALTSSSSQLRSRLMVPLADNLTFQVQNETTLSKDQDAIYSDRTLLDLNWGVMPGVNIRLNQQFFHGGQLAGQSATTLQVTGEQKLGSDTTLTGRYSIVGGANGLLSQGAVGLNQRWAVTPGLLFNFTYEHIFGDLSTQTAAGTQFLQPFATGQSASALTVQGSDNYSIGLEYTDSPDFKASARYEFRNGGGGTNTVISAAALGKVSPAFTVLMNYNQASGANQLITGLGTTANLKLGLAYRDPNNDNFNALLRYEYRMNPSSIPESVLFSSGSSTEDHTLALEAIYAPNWQWEFYGKYAVRNSVSYLAKDLVGFNNISLGQLRATYRLGYNMDLVGEARWINQPNAGYSETGFVLEAGYYLTPNLRASLGYSSGSVNRDRDFSGSRSDGGFYAGLTFKLNELFDGFGLQKVVPRQQQESRISAQPAAKPTLQAATPAPLRLNVSQMIEFESDQTTLTARGTAVLDSLALVLKEYPDLTIDIQGYLASLSDIQAGTNIEVKRLQAARTYLLSRGVTGSQMLIRSLGKRPTEPVATNTGIPADNVSFALSGSENTFKLIAARLQNAPDALSVSPLLQSLLPKVDATEPVLSASSAIADPSRNLGSTVAPATSTTSQTPAEQAAETLQFTAGDELDAASIDRLNEIAEVLQKNPAIAVELFGGDTNASEQAQAVSMSRAMAARSYLIEQGANPDQILVSMTDTPAGVPIASRDRQLSFVLSSLDNTDTPIADTTLISPQAAEPTLSPQAAEPTLSPQAAEPTLSPQAQAPTPSDNLLSRVLQFTAGDELDQASLDKLNQIAEVLQKNPAIAVQLQSNSQLEPSASNSTPTVKMSRLMSVRDYLLGKGISSEQILLGTTQTQPTPLATNATEAIPVASRDRQILYILSTLDGTPIADSSLISPQAATPIPVPQAFLPQPFQVDGPVLADAFPNTLQVLPSLSRIQPFTSSMLLPDSDPENRFNVLAIDPMALGFSDTRLSQLLAPAAATVLQASQPVAPTTLQSLAKPTENRELRLSANQPSSTRTRKLASALNFLLSQDTDTLRALLQAMGVSQPEVKGEIVNLDDLVKGSEPRL